MNPNALSSLVNAKLPTCIQQINNPTHRGWPNPAHGQFMIVGTIPGECYDQEKQRSKIYPTLEACAAAIESAGVTRYQLPDCTWNKT